MPERQARKLLLTGPPGIGKTAVVRRLLQGCAGARLAGFVTEELRGGLANERVGFRMVPLAGGPARTLAHVGLVSRQRVGRYGVDVEIVDYVSDTALRPRPGVDLFVVDEIGKMECFSRRFVAAIERLLEHETPLLATVALHGEGLIAAVKAHPQVALWHVTADNRDELASRALAWLGVG